MTVPFDQWLDTIREHSRIFTESFGGLSVNELNWKNNEGSWSVAQVIEHLIRINESYYPILDQLSAGTYRTPWVAGIGFYARFMGNFLEKSLEPERKRKIRTFPLWEPSTSNIDGDIVGRFVSHHDALIKKLQANRQLFGKGKVISSPANKYVVYPLDKVVDILIVHEKRHYNQALEVKSFQKGTQF